MFDNGQAAVGIGEPASAVLVIVGLFDDEQLLIREEQAVPVKRYGLMKKSLPSFMTYIIAGEELNFLQLL